MQQSLDQSQMSFDYLMAYIMSISMCMQNFITIFHSIQEIGPFSLFQNLELGKASIDEKMSFRNLLLISMFTQKFIKIFHSVQEIGLFSLFQNLNLGNASANPKWHLTISWATSCQYQCVCKSLSKYSKRFKSYQHFSRTGWGQNLHKLSGDKKQMFDSRALYESQPSVSADFLGACNISGLYPIQP